MHFLLPPARQGIVARPTRTIVIGFVSHSLAHSFDLSASNTFHGGRNLMGARYSVANFKL
jgi:hypothetical protein